MYFFMYLLKEAHLHLPTILAHTPGWDEVSTTQKTFWPIDLM